MKAIALIKPDMAVMRRDRLGLSPFGMLGLAFQKALAQRSTWQTGFYREESLDLLEQDAPPAAASPDMQLNVNLNVALEALKEKNKNTKDATTRILERVYVLERQIEQMQAPISCLTVRLAQDTAQSGRAVNVQPASINSAIRLSLASAKKIVENAVLKPVHGDSFMGTHSLRASAVAGTRGLQKTSIAEARGAQEPAIARSHGLQKTSITELRGARESAIASLHGFQKTSITGIHGAREPAIAGAQIFCRKVS